MPTSETQNDGLAAGSSLGKYDIKRQLGRGGMGAVYEGLHRDLKKRVAIKVLMPQLAANEEAKLRFLREGEAASRISHPHVVDVTDVGSEGTITYLVMEFLEGEDLAHRLARGPLSLQEAADIMLPVLAGVSAAHDEGVIHRDLKPENIFLCRTRSAAGVQPKVLDFGVSKLSGGTSALALTGTAATFGTPYYIPPEQLRGARQADKRSDQYSLGVVLYEAVCGRRPFEAENVYAMLRAIAEGEYPSPRSVFPQLNEAMEQIIVKAMQLDPAQRFVSLRHFGAALLPFASDTARALWSGEFGSVGSMSASSSMPAGGTMVLSQDAAAAVLPKKPSGAITGRRGTGSVSGTKILPSSTPSNTTFGSATGQRFDGAPAEDLRPSSRRGLVLGIVALVVVAGGGGAYYFLKSPPQPPVVAHPAPQFFQVDVTTDPSNASVELDGQATGVGALQRRMEKDGQDHRLVARAPGFEDAVVRFHDEPPPQIVRLIAKPQAIKPVVVKPDTDTTPIEPVKPPVAAGGGHSSGGHHHGHEHDHPPQQPTKPIPTGPTPGSHPTTPNKPPEAPNGAPIIE
jgi:serine/threonine-protein kinase